MMAPELTPSSVVTPNYSKKIPQWDDCRLVIHPIPQWDDCRLVQPIHLGLPVTLMIHLGLPTPWAIPHQG